MQYLPINHDFPINELPKPIIELLTKSSLPWLNSLEFCTQYTPYPAERIAIKLYDSQIKQVIFYRIYYQFRFLRIIEIIGFPNISEEEAKSILIKQNAHLILFNSLENAVKPVENWVAHKKNIICKNYIAIIDLPFCKEKYFNSLRKNDKRQLPRYFRKLNTEYNNIELRYETKQDIKFEEVMALELLNRKRRESKGKGIDTIHEIRERQLRRWTLTQNYGLLTTIRHDGTILGGTLTYLYEKEALMIIVAHDFTLDNFRVGKLSIWKTIDYLIEHGFTQLNFLWGRMPFKTHFLGVEYPWSITILSPYWWLTSSWISYFKLKGFYNRAWRFLKTRLKMID